MGAGQNVRSPVVAEPPSVLRVRAGCGGRPFTAKLPVVVHYLLHQVFDDLLKPFEQRELQGTVTIRPALKIPNQKVTQE